LLHGALLGNEKVCIEEKRVIARPFCPCSLLYLPVLLRVMSRKYYFLLSSIACFCSAAFAQFPVTVNMDESLREMDGFGASSGWYTDEYMTLLDASTRADFIEAMFDPKTGLGLTLHRVRIDSDFEGNSQTYPFINWEHEPYDGQFAREVQDAYDPYLMLSQWTPPPWMKDNNSKFKGGSLLPEYYDEYALYQAEYILDLKNEFGVEVDGFSFQNEPGVKSWASCEWTTAQIIDYLKNHLIPTFIDKGLIPADPSEDWGVDLMVNEETAWNDHQLNAILEDPAIEPHIRIAAAHNYGRNYATRTFDTARSLGKRVWQTEFYNKGREGEDNDTIGYGLLIGRIMHNFFINNDVNLYNYWWMMSASGKDQQGLIKMTDDKTGFAVMKQGYVFGQYSRFIRPGYQRIANSNPFPQLGAGVNGPIDTNVTIGVSAYTNVTGDRLVVIAINDTANPESIDLTIVDTDGSIGTMEAWRTSETENMQAVTPVAVTDNEATLSLPPYSITTYVGETGTDL